MPVVLLAASAPASAQQFSGDFVFRWTTEPSGAHRVMTTVNPVSFRDKAGKVWKVPAGKPIDGASIPQAMWTFAGSPFVGNYRRASVIHDYFCDNDSENPDAIHDMFFDAMEADDVREPKLTGFFMAVKAFASGKRLLGQPYCGKPKRDWTVFSKDIKNVFEMSEALRTELKQLDESAGASQPDLKSRTERVADISDVRFPLTFAATVTFRRVPSTENLDALHLAIAQERPSRQEAAAIADLAIATVPEGSITGMTDR